MKLISLISVWPVSTIQYPDKIDTYNERIQPDLFLR